MSSQKSIDRQREPVRPKRQRGRERVFAIVEAAVDLFAAQEYSAVTMTEIAARSGTAIGSLYRFFPTKAHVADEILARYDQSIRREFDECAAEAGSRPIAETAADLIERVAALGRYRAAGLALIDARNELGEPVKAQIGNIRGTMQAGVARVLAAAQPGMPEDDVAACALAVLQVLKTAANSMRRAEGEQDILRRELRRMLVLYLHDCARRTAVGAHHT